MSISGTRMNDPVIDSRGVIPGVSMALRALIGEELRFGPLSEWSITFESPAELDGNEGPRLCLYLYLVEPNASLRNLPGTIVMPQGDGGAREKIVRPVAVDWEPPPAVVDLHYMIVPYAHSAELELQLADCLIRALDRRGVIPEVYLDKELKDSGNTNMRVIPERASIHTLRDLWSSFPQRMFRLTRLYSISPVFVPVAAPVSASLVEQLEVSVVGPQGDS